MKSNSIQLILLAFAALAVNQTVTAQDDEDFFPGLLATYSTADHSVERVDSVLSFDWGAGPPDERLPAGDFSATWSSNLLVRLPGTHRFHAFVAGTVSISVDGNEVLKTSQPWGFASGEPFDLSAGDHEIKVTYSTPEESDKPRAGLSVFWSSDKFTLEPLPADVLYRDEPSPARNAMRGRLIADSHRCSACHRSKSDTDSLSAPTLDRIRESQTHGTLVQRLINPQSVVANSHMPHFGMNQTEAENVAAFLRSVSRAPHQNKPVKFKDNDASAGTKLLNSLGCVACHQLPGTNQDTHPLSRPYDAPELVTVGKRRSVDWLNRWLRIPETLNADHRMPVFDLSTEERRQIIAALTTNSQPTTTDNAVSTKPGDIAAGKQLVMAANCAACHKIPGIEPKPERPLTAGSLTADENQCHLHRPVNTAGKTDAARRPFYPQLSGNAAENVTAWVSTSPHQGETGMFDKGSLLLKRNGCTACHDRDADRGLSSTANRLQNTHPDLQGRSQGLVPPPLTAIGDKLSNDYLNKAVAGEQKERRLPWLLVRMPKFRHTDAERAAIVHHLIASDRIPDEADGARQDVLAHVDLSGESKASTEDLLLGNRLTGAGGFNCVACHKAGPFEPRNVALGTRGSDIMTMGSRIRSRFFQRWMKNPIRVVAGIEMPAIKKAMPDVLDGSLQRQIAAMWKALRDDRFTPPTVTSRFEQVVNVEPGGPPRIIRDVFTIGTDKDREPVARAMAIGFNNGHNILIDLDTMRVRRWTMGEFARQRTEGKSWYWDMPGVPVQTGPSEARLFQLKTKTGLLAPLPDEGRFAEVLNYRQDDAGVDVTTVWRFTAQSASESLPPKEPHFTSTVWEQRARDIQRVVLKHRFEPANISAGAERSGWKHSVTVLEAPENSVLTGWLSIFQEPAPNQLSSIAVQTTGARLDISESENQTATLTVDKANPVIKAALPKPPIVAAADRVVSTPGFIGHRLPVHTSIMPTAMTWLPDGRLAFTSLKGHVWIAEDTDADGLPDKMALFEEGLAAPFGILADGDSLVVSHKPEILRLRDTSGDGRADEHEVFASGWGFNDNYHDWASGLVRDHEGNMYVGLGSDYSQKGRPDTQDRWRGGVIKIDPSGIITPLGMSMRYPMGLAIDRFGNLFATDNQGVQNTFNEINHILPGKHYGVPSRHQPTENLQAEEPAIMVPHPWTRSVNSILFLPDDFPVAELRGHGIGCEYDSRFLIRFTVQNVNGTLQGASYRFSLPNQEAGGSNFIGPICSAVSPNGELYIGSIWDSGWQGGQNTGGITRLIPSPDGIPNGIRELTATPAGFEVEFFQPVDPGAAKETDSWSLQGYTRKWGGSYATPDSGRYTPKVSRIDVLDAGRRVRIQVDNLKAGYLYDVSTTGKLADGNGLWPSEAHYSMKSVPK